MLRFQQLPWERYLLIGLGLSFLMVVVLLPLLIVFYQAFASGIAAYWQGITTPEAQHAIAVTFIIALLTIPLNTAFGIAIAWILARYQFPGKVALLGLLDLPLAVSPVVVGLMFILLYSPTVGLFAHWVTAFNLKVIFALPGMVLTTLFITLPFVAREVLPVLQNMGLEEEEAAQTLGANAWQTFWRVTFPTIRWALLYGVILCTSRAIGEFGAVSVISGKLILETNTLTLHIEQVYTEYQTVAAFACASLLALLALLTLAAQALLQMIDHPRSLLPAQALTPKK
ncbi:sulfate ABC transporter permease subunit CysW [Leptolyngbya sp. NK1-12]|uniref:Sulfate ABC transporter permease subunit CysW n=2 Tax=Leptolyngbya sp. NK1-12 TaxID=2547451 RepID=A0AA97AJK6_9CYAN|nr:sulfate ABC transporter permease subunit CysW [Leptolyngbya sp. NK1-12]